MSDRFKWALSPANLALLGALDDFYDVYCSIIDIYNEHANCYYDENGKEKALTPWALDNLARRDVRKACEPLLNKHLHIFSEILPIYILVIPFSCPCSFIIRHHSQFLSKIDQSLKV